MTYGEFGSVVNTQDNSHVRDLLEHNVVLEMDGLSSNSDRTMFSEALTLYLYRHRLAQGPQMRLTNMIILEEAHNLLLQKAQDAKESVLENSIRMIRQYGMGYLFVDQSASMLSKVAFANSYATIALSQKLRADTMTIAGAMNLADEQKEALNTLPVGTAIVRLADEFPEPFLIKVPRCPIEEGAVSDDQIRARMRPYSAVSKSTDSSSVQREAVPPLPAADGITEKNPRPPSPKTSAVINVDTSVDDFEDQPPVEAPEMSREAIRFLADVAARPLSTTVARYQRLHLSRRKGNAIRQDLVSAGLIAAVALATRSGQVVLYELTDAGRSVCGDIGIEPGPARRESLEHRYWVHRAAAHFEDQGYAVTRELAVPGDGVVDIAAERNNERLAIEIETGKSDIRINVEKLQQSGFDRVLLIATTPSAVSACQRVLESLPVKTSATVELLTWLDVS